MACNPGLNRLRRTCFKGSLLIRTNNGARGKVFSALPFSIDAHSAIFFSLAAIPHSPVAASSRCLGRGKTGDVRTLLLFSGCSIAFTVHCIVEFKSKELSNYYPSCNFNISIVSHHSVNGMEREGLLNEMQVRARAPISVLLE